MPQRPRSSIPVGRRRSTHASPIRRSRPPTLFDLDEPLLFWMRRGMTFEVGERHRPSVHDGARGIKGRRLPHRVEVRYHQTPSTQLSSSKEDTMGARAEALAKQFETKAKDATAVLERLGEADWKKTTATEQWPVGVVAHHVAGGYEAIVGIVKTLAEGKPGPNLPMDALHAMNVKHAQEHANCTKAE